LIHSIYIVNQSGETEASVTLGDFQADEALFGGFMSAIRTFSEHMSGDAIEEMVLGNYRLIVAGEEKHFLVTIHDKNDKNPIDASRGIASAFREGIKDGLSEDLLSKIKEAATESKSKRDQAKDWASKML
jgi:hypothetical protein